jgi:hypothetical protein
MLSVSVAKPELLEISCSEDPLEDNIRAATDFEKRIIL